MSDPAKALARQKNWHGKSTGTGLERGGDGRRGQRRLAGPKADGGARGRRNGDGRKAGQRARMKPNQSTSLVQTQQLRLNMGLATSIRILRYDASGLTRYLEEQAAINPFLSLHPVEPAPGEWLPRWTGAFGRRDTDYGAVTEAVQAGPSPSLAAHASAAIDRLVPAGRGRALALALVQALEPSGWLGRPLGTIATEAGASLPEMEAILSVMQRIDPPGLFARSLAECLRLQAADAGCLDAGMAGMLDNLDLLASGNLARLARVCRITEAEVARRLALIRSFDPKPGTQFDASPLPSGEPDLLVTRGENGWQVALNRSALPELRITAPQKR
ncbi:MAG: hypothetical protein U1D06_12185, partial [Paracoccaceae bacterium]|nr:hypothetical protein [Paracoccaceae bacterium]